MRGNKADCIIMSTSEELPAKFLFATKNWFEQTYRKKPDLGKREAQYAKIWPNMQFLADLVTFIKEIFNVKLNFLWTGNSLFGDFSSSKANIYLRN